jgi:class 3 adenylate cyclase/tetratricopeptide (TPR) repeat protein
VVEAADPGGLERRIVTVLFCDLAGFTTLSERLDAEDVAIVQSAYFEAVRDSVARHGGTVEKFIGDAAVAVYGVPIAGDRDAEQAVRSGLAIVGAVEVLNDRLGLDGRVLDVRVGVNTGDAVVHPEPAPGEPMVTGDVVNTAARLQAAAPLNGVLVGPDTALAVAGAVELDDAGELELKGKARPVRAARAVAAFPEPERERAMGALRAPTIGRSAELALVDEALEECRASGTGRRLTVVAPPGTGKTRLLDDFAALASGRGAVMRRCRVRADVLAAFQPVVELVSAALAAARIDAGDEAALRKALEAALDGERASAVGDELLALLSAAERGDDGGDSEARRGASFAAWSDGLAALGDGVEVWLVEDVHWSGSDLRAFLAAATSSRGRGRLVVCTSRPSLLEEDRSWLEGGGLLELEPLSTPASEELVRALVGDALGPELVAHVGERAGGNPLFVEELLRAWAGAGLLERADAGWRLTRPIADVELPSTVQSAYAAQLDDLPRDARSLVRRAAVVGRQFSVAAVEALDDAGATGIDSLLRRGLVHGPVDDPLFGPSYVFRHALLRDVGYASLSRAARSLLHVRTARWLQDMGALRPDDVAEVAGRHYAAALASAPVLASDLGDGLGREEAAGRAAGWFARAGDAALAAAAYDSARAAFERSLELTVPGESVERGTRLLGLARATAFTADMDAGLAAAEEALACLRAIARDGGTDEARQEASRAVVLVGAIYGQQLRFDDVVSLADDALLEFGDQDDDVTARLLLARIRGAAMIGDEAYEATTDDRARALALARSSADRDLELDARIWTADDEPDQRAAWREIENAATRLQRWPEVADALRTQAALCFPDDLDGAEASAVRLASFARARQLDESAAWACYYRAETNFARGRWDAALEWAGHATDVGVERSYHRVTVRTWHVVVPIAAARGDRVRLEEAARWYEELGDRFPDTPYGRLSRAAVDALLRNAGVSTASAPEAASLVPSFAEDVGLPSWLEALDVVLAELLASGALAEAREALRVFGSTVERRGAVAIAATHALLWARVRHAEGGADADVRGHVSTVRSAGAPWPTLKGLRLLADAGEAGAADLAEAQALSELLGL